ncbi:MAG TPA: adenylyltransferase/cytidyltransferase family protein [Methylorubrum populi]|uniref:ethanolamine-phosphate cytidylyltransferase n=1 Tax=Methylorubrum populi TaxID=223967 RepID=A0A921JF82_9HYPH|nr:adenylyltransferase/cytidyltransferase family protein [Methylorubrum populi]
MNGRGDGGASVYAKVVVDLLHPGHVRFFAAARALGSRLTVCVVPDERVAAYKGRPPVLTLEERVEIVAACRWVDAVVTDGPRVIDRAFMRGGGYDIYAFGGAHEAELATKLADCADLPEAMRAIIPYTPGISSTLLRHRLAGG